MWYAFFVVGGFWFWSLAVIEVLFLSYFVHDENPLGSFLSVLIFVLLIHLFGDANFFVYLKNHPWDIVRLGAIYAIAGFIWACCKFYYNNQKVVNKIKQLKETFVEKYAEICKEFSREDKTGSDDEAVWKWYMKRNLDSDNLNKLGFIHQGTQIVFWMAYWPISMFWTFFTDILKNFAEWCYETFLINIFRGIHNKTIGKAVKFDMSLPKDTQ